MAHRPGEKLVQAWVPPAFHDAVAVAAEADHISKSEAVRRALIWTLEPVGERNPLSSRRTRGDAPGVTRRRDDAARMFARGVRPAKVARELRLDVAAVTRWLKERDFQDRVEAWRWAAFHP